jgi:hypothetical protein
MRQLGVCVRSFGKVHIGCKEATIVRSSLFQFQANQLLCHPHGSIVRRSFSVSNAFNYTVCTNRELYNKCLVAGLDGAIPVLPMSHLPWKGYSW